MKKERIYFIFNTKQIVVVKSMYSALHVLLLLLLLRVVLLLMMIASILAEV